MNKKFILLLLFLALIFFSPFFQLGSLISVGPLPPETQVVNWEGVSVTLTSPYFGTIIDAPMRDICGTNDGDISLSNSFTVSKTLTLHSSISTISKRTCQSQNYLYASFISPSDGVYNFVYTLEGNNGGYSGSGSSEIHINSFSKTLSIEENTMGSVPAGTIRDSYSLPVKKGEPVEVKLYTQKPYVGGTSSSVDITFISSEVSSSVPISTSTSASQSSSINFFDSFLSWLKSFFDRWF